MASEATRGSDSEANTLLQPLAGGVPIVITSCFGDRYWAALGPWLTHLRALTPCVVEVISGDGDLHAGEMHEPDVSVVGVDYKHADWGMHKEAWRSRLERVIHHISHGRTVAQIDVDVLLKRDFSPLCGMNYDFIVSRAFALPPSVQKIFGFVACCGFFIAKPSARQLCAALLENMERNVYDSDDDQEVLNLMLCGSISNTPRRQEMVQVAGVSLELDVFHCEGCSVAVLPDTTIHRSPLVGASTFGNHHRGILEIFLAKSGQPQTGSAPCKQFESNGEGFSMFPHSPSPTVAAVSPKEREVEQPSQPFGALKPEELIKAFLGGGSGACDIRIMARLMAAVSSTNYYLQHMNSAPTLAAQHMREFAMKRREPKDGLVLEFGVNRGTTIRQIASLSDGKVYGFDSFLGLPEAWQFGSGKHLFAGREPPQVPANVELVIGWFADTLPGFLEVHAGQAAFLHIDCDIYSSTRDVLNALERRIGPGTIIVFDEYYNYPQWEDHEFRAWREFVQRCGVVYEYLAVDPGGQQVCVRVQANRAFSA